MFFCSASVAFASVRVCVIKTGILLPGVTFWGFVRDESHADDGHEEAKAGQSGAAGKDAEQGMRKRLLRNFDFFSSLQALMNEVQLLREEQRRTQQEFAETLR